MSRGSPALPLEPTPTRKGESPYAARGRVHHPSLRLAEVRLAAAATPKGYGVYSSPTPPSFSIMNEAMKAIARRTGFLIPLLALLPACQQPPLFPSSPFNLYIARLEWGQSVLKENLRLVQGKPALLRAYLVSTAPGVRARVDLTGDVYQGSTLLGNLTFTCPAPLPTAPDPSRLANSCNATLPAGWVVPDLKVVLTADPNNQVPETDKTDNTLTLTPTVGAGTVLHLTVVPVIHQGVQPQIPSFRDYVWSIWPLKEISYTARASYTTSVVLNTYNDWRQLLNEIKTLRQTDGSNRYYYGFVRVDVKISNFSGIGFIAYPAAAGWDDPKGGPITMAHELGHNFGLRHTPCGNPSDLDPNYPYPDGKIGTWGYSLATDELYDPEQYHDLMSYCGPRWISDYGYQKVQTFLESNPPSPQALSRGEYILLSGRIEGDSIHLYPPVYYTGYPVENRPGEYRLEVETPTGRKTISFAPVEDSLGGLSFQVSLQEAPTALRLYRGATLLLEKRASVTPLSTWQASLREEAGRVLLTWEGAPYASLVHIASDGTRTTLGLWQTGSRAEFPTGGLPAGGTFEVQLSDGLRVERYRFGR